MRRGLKPRDGAAGRAAVLVLDLISDFDFPDGPRVRHALQARSTAICRLLSAARSQRVPVIYANDNLGRWRSDFPALLSHCTEARRAGAKLVEMFAPAATDDIILKPRHSAFFGTPLAALLDDRGLDTLILIGVSAESCVWMSACDAHTRGFGLVVPRDTLAGASAKAMRATMTGLSTALGARIPARAASLRFRRGRLE